MQTASEQNPVQSVFAGLVSREQLAADIRRSIRTIRNYELAGMPHVHFGNFRLFDPASVRAWLMSHERQHNTPKRGRPARNRAA